MDSFRKPQKECPWMFGFKLMTVQRTYELYAPNKHDLKHWLRIFNIVLQMNSKGVQFKFCAPLMFEREEKNKLEQKTLPQDDANVQCIGPVNKLQRH